MASPSLTPAQPTGDHLPQTIDFIIFSRVLTFQQDGTDSPLKQSIETIVEHVRNGHSIERLPMYSFAVSPNLRPAAKRNRE
jgi:hypothetical protein